MSQEGLEYKCSAVFFMYLPFAMELLPSHKNAQKMLPWDISQTAPMTLAAFQIQNHSVMQWSITHSQNCNSPSASSGLVRSMTPGPSFPSSLGFPVNWGPKFSNLVLSWKRTEVVLMLKYFISHCELVHGCIH